MMSYTPIHVSINANDEDQCQQAKRRDFLERPPLQRGKSERGHEGGGKKG